jgi:predicted nucleic acid-binding protein
VDTSVWSLALRRRQLAVVHPAARELALLVEEMQACLLGAIRQEILSGLRDPAQFEKLRDHLRAFPDLEVTTADHERAAEFFNLCRARGVQGSNTDFLICAVAERHGLSIFSADADFTSFAMHLPIALHSVRP